MNVVELKKRAVALEQALNTNASESVAVAEFANYIPLLSAIQRAKAGEIFEPEEIPGMYHWKFETDIFWKHKNLGDVFAGFSLLLRGL